MQSSSGCSRSMFGFLVIAAIVTSIMILPIIIVQEQWYLLSSKSLLGGGIFLFCAYLVNRFIGLYFAPPPSFPYPHPSGAYRTDFLMKTQFGRSPAMPDHNTTSPSKSFYQFNVVILFIAGCWLIVNSIAVYTMDYSVIIFKSISQQHNSAGNTCTSLGYYQIATGLPDTGQADYPAYTYGDFLSAYQGPSSPKGYNVIYATPSTKVFGSISFVGKTIVFDPGAFGADGVSGHIGLVTAGGYDQFRSLWIIDYMDASGWTNDKISLGKNLSDRGCTNVAIRRLVTSDLSGIRFFEWSKK